MSPHIPITLVSEFYPHQEGEAHGGVEMRVWNIACRLASVFDVHVITSHEAGTDALESDQGVTVHRVGGVRPYAHSGHLADRFRFMRAIPKVIEQIGPRIIDAQSFATYLPCIATGRRMKIPTILTFHDVWKGRWITLFGISGLIGEVYERIILRKSWDHGIANSNVTRQLLEQAGVSSGRLSVIPNGIDIESFSGAVSKFDQPTICCITRLVDYKCVGDLIEAVALLRATVPTLACNIIGIGPARASLEQLIRDRGLVDSVHLLGFIEDRHEMINILKRSHVFCLPSSIEGFGMVLLESMAAGVPCVAADIPAVREVSDNGTAAALYQVRNIDQLTATLKTVLTDSVRSKELITHSTQMLSHYSWDAIARSTQRLYMRYL